MTQSNATATEERLWTYDAVRVGQASPPTQVTLLAEHIAEYAACAQNPDPRYLMPSPEPAGGRMMAMPTMALTYAPLLREEIAEANGLVAQERSTTARRQTPFAKCEVRWHSPMRAGDTITSVGRVIDKYERRGSKFVTFRVEARNQHDELVAEYDYTSIFEYAKGQKHATGQGKATEVSRQ